MSLHFIKWLVCVIHPPGCLMIIYLTCGITSWYSIRHSTHSIVKRHEYVYTDRFKHWKWEFCGPLWGVRWSVCWRRRWVSLPLRLFQQTTMWLLQPLLPSRYVMKDRKKIIRSKTLVWKEQNSCWKSRWDIRLRYRNISWFQ